MAGHANPNYNTLDVPELQMLTEFDDDPNNLTFHHRIFFYRVEGGRWIVGTPDGDVYVQSAADRRVLSLKRNSPFPARHLHEIYAF